MPQYLLPKTTTQLLQLLHILLSLIDLLPLRHMRGTPNFQNTILQRHYPILSDLDNQIHGDDCP